MRESDRQNDGMGSRPSGLAFPHTKIKQKRKRKRKRKEKPHRSNDIGQLWLMDCPHQVSFGVAPATAAFALGLRTPLDALLLSFFVLCGLTRLARFNVTVSNLPKDATGKSKYFEGFPIPTSLSIVGAMAACILLGHVEGGESGVVGGNMGEGTMLEFHPVVGVFVVWGCALVSRTIHIPKP